MLFLVNACATKFEFTLYEGVKGRGGSPMPVKTHYILLPKSDEPEVEKPEEVSADPEPLEETKMDKAEYPNDEAPAEEPEPVPEPQEPEREDEKEGDLTLTNDEESEPEPEEIIEEKVPPEPPTFTNIVVTFDPESPQYTDIKSTVSGSISGLQAGDFYLSVERLVEGNGKEFVGEIALNPDGERTTDTLTELLHYQASKVPVPSYSLLQLEYPLQHP